MEPKKRLTMAALRANEWIQGNSSKPLSITPLKTPSVLGWSRGAVTHQITATMDAFHMAHREGFRLQDVQKAPLAQRRKLKKSSSGSGSSMDSCRSSNSRTGSLTPTKQLLGGAGSPARSSPVRNLSNNSQCSTTSTGFTPHRAQQTGNSAALESSDYFSFKESRIAVLTGIASCSSTSGSVSSSSSSANEKNNNNNNQETLHNLKKRKLDSLEDDEMESDDDEFVHVDDNDDDDDDDEEDCIIVDEEAPPLSLDCSTSIQPSDAKRPRSDTIVLE